LAGTDAAGVAARAGLTAIARQVVDIRTAATTAVRVLRKLLVLFELVFMVGLLV
jgi:hypothetical protein